MITRHPWTGVLCKVRTPSTDHRVLHLPSGEHTVPTATLPLKLITVDGPDDLPTDVGTVEKVWLDGDVVWASGKITLNPDSPLGERMLTRLPHPVGVRTWGGEADMQDHKWWHSIDRFLGNEHPPVQVHTGWTLHSVYLVDEPAWLDAFITLDDSPTQDTPAAAGFTHTDR